MPKLAVKNRLRATTLLLLFIGVSSFYTFHNVSMWHSALTSSRDNSAAMGTFVEASKWLSKNLGQDEIAVVPTIEVFYVLNPELRGRLVDYKSIWNSVGVEFRDRSDQDKMLQLRAYFIVFLNFNFSVRYIVRDWVDPYAKYLFEQTVNDDLMLLLREVKVVPFTLSSGWSNRIRIYEKVKYTALFVHDLSSPPKQYHTIPSNAPIQFSSNGSTIQKVGPSVGFYLPLEAGINASKQSCTVTMQVKPDLENSYSLLVFYYDKNRDGRFSGYEIDYVKSFSFNQTKLGWVKGEWYKIAQTIPSAEDPMVQIGIIISGDEDGAVTLYDLNVYTEITPEV